MFTISDETRQTESGAGRLRTGDTCSGLTSDGIPGQAQLADDVAGNVRFHQMPLLGVILRRLQQVVKLLGVKLLEGDEHTPTC